MPNHASRSRLTQLAILAVLVLVTASCSTDPGPEVWVIGLDGADWDQLGPMMDRGELPHLKALRDGGAAGILRSDTPMISPILWSSIATGKTPDRHGVTWFMSEAEDGTMMPVSSMERDVRAFWDIASDQGLSCGIVGWWATWPADPVNGFLVSDYVAWHSFGVTGRSTVDEGKTWPPEMITRVEGHMPSPADVDDALLTRLVNRPAADLALDPQADPYADPVAHLRQALATSRGYTDLVLAELDRERPDLMSVYYEGTDAVSHLFGDYQPPRLPWVSAEDFAAYRNVVDEYWKWQDGLVGELLAKRGPETTVIVISDHGFRRGEERRKEDHFAIETADADHMADGVIMIHGPGVEPGTRIDGADIYDVAPTVLYALGLAVPDDMDGRLLADVFSSEHRHASPIRTVATYETSPRPRATEVASDDEANENLEKMLRSLGYIAGGASGSSDNDIASAEQAVNLATVLMNQGRADEAAENLRKVLETHPGHAEVRQNLAQALARSGRPQEAEAIYRELVAEHPERLEFHEDLAIFLEVQADHEGALEAVAAGLDQDPDWAAGLAYRGWFEFELGRTAAAEADLRRSLELDPSRSATHTRLAQVLAAGNDGAGARAALQRAHDLDPADRLPALLLAENLAQDGQAERALAVLDRNLQVGGRDPKVLGKYGAILLQAGRAAEAIEPLEEAQRLDPGDAQETGNLGMAYALTGRMDQAIATFEKVVELAPDMAGAHAQLGAFYFESGQEDKALASLQAAVAKDPDDAGFRMNLASTHHRAGNLEAAREQYREAIRLAPDFAAAYYYLGMVETRLGNEDEGARLISQARELDPTLPAR